MEGPLFTREIERCFVGFEISKGERVLREPKWVEFDPPYPDVLPFTVWVMDLEEICAEKIRSILTRNMLETCMICGSFSRSRST